MNAQIKRPPIKMNQRTPFQACEDGQAFPSQSRPTEAFATVVTNARQRPAKRGTRGVGLGRRSKTSQELPKASRLSRRDRKT
jgi:hypothetical protein